MEIGKPHCFSPLYRAAHWLAVAMLILIPLQVAVFVLSPPPDTVRGFFELYGHNPFLGLLSLDFIYLFSNAIIVVLYLALFARLFPERPSAASAAIALGLVGIAVYYPSNPAFEMLTLSSLYLQAPAGRQMVYLAAGEAVLAGYTGTAFNVYYVFNAMALLLFAFAVLKSPRFSRSTGWWGLAAGVLMIVPSTAGLPGLIFSLLSLVPWMVFVALLALHFDRFSRQVGE